MTQKVGIEFTATDAGLLNGFDNAIKKADELGDTTERSLEKVRNAFGSAGQGADIYDKSLDQTVKKSQAQARENETLSQSLRKVIGDYELFGVSLNGIERGLGKGVENMQSLRKATLNTSGSFKILKAALISTGIGALLVALGSLVAFLTRTQKGVDLVSKGAAALGATFNVLVDRAASVGESLINAFSNPIQSLKRLGNAILNPVDSINKLINGTKELTNEIKEEASAAIALEDRQQRLRDAQIALRVETAKRRAEIKELNKVAEDTTKSFQQRENAARKAGEIESELLSKRTRLAEENFEIIKAQNSLGNSLTKDLQAQADAEVRISELKTESVELQTTLQNKLNTIVAEQRNQIKSLRDEYTSLNNELLDQLRALNLEEADPVTKLQLAQQFAIEALEKQRDKLIKVAQSLGEPVDGINEKFDTLIDSTNKKFERQIELQGLNTEKIATKNSDKIVEVIEKSKKKAEEELKDKPLLESPERVFGLETATIKTNGVKIEKEPLLLQMERLLEEIGGSLQEFFESDLGKGIVSGIGASVQLAQELFSILLDGLDKQLDSIQEVRQERQNDIEELESELDKKKELQEKGFSVNISAKEEELSKLKELEEADAKRQQELEERKARIQQQQDNIQQASSLITAAAQIYSGFASIPVVGLPLALLAVATLFGAFAKVKLDAKKATRLYTGANRVGEHFGEVAPNGKSDIPGRGNGYDVVDSDTGRHTGVKIGGDEMLVDEKTTRSHGDVFRWVKDYSNMYSSDEMLSIMQSASKMPDISNRTSSMVKKSNNMRAFYAGLTKEEMTDVMEVATTRVIQKYEKYKNSQPVHFSEGGKSYVKVTT